MSSQSSRIGKKSSLPSEKFHTDWAGFNISVKRFYAINTRFIYWNSCWKCMSCFQFQQTRFVVVQSCVSDLSNNFSLREIVREDFDEKLQIHQTFNKFSSKILFALFFTHTVSFVWWKICLNFIFSTNAVWWKKRSVWNFSLG